MAGTLMEITLLYLSSTTPTSPRQAIFATKSSDFALFFRAPMILCLSSRIPHVVTSKVGRAKMRSHSCKTWVGVKGIYKPPFLWAEVDITSLLRLIWCPVAGTRCSWHTDPFMSYTDKPDFTSLSIRPSSTDNTIQYQERCICVKEGLFPTRAKGFANCGGWCRKKNE